MVLADLPSVNSLVLALEPLRDGVQGFEGPPRVLGPAVVLSKPTLNALVQSATAVACEEGNHSNRHSSSSSSSGSVHEGVEARVGGGGLPLLQLGTFLQKNLSAHKSPVYHVGLEFAFDLGSSAGYQLTSAFLQQYMQMKGRFKHKVRTNGTLKSI